MLPKVATHLLHTTSRAAAAVHNQTSTLRGVFQLQTSPGPSAAVGTAPAGPWNGSNSSSWDSHGPGPGGAKKGTGNRFYSGFTGPVRAVTQANAVTSQDGSLVQHEDSREDTAKRQAAVQVPKDPHLRPSNTSMGGAMSRRRECTDNLSVLRTVQVHAQSRHPFTQPSNTIGAPQLSSTAAAKKTPPHPLITRRNSTSSTVELSSLFVNPTRANSTYVAPSHSSIDPASIPLPPSPRAGTVDLPSTDHPASPQTTHPPRHNSKYPTQRGRRTFTPETEAYLALKAARDTGDPAAVVGAVRHFRQTAENSTVPEFNMALEALVSTRRAGEPLTLLLETYNDMIKLSLIPTIKTYALLIQALTDRDLEVYRVMRTVRNRLQRRANITGDLEFGSQAADEERLSVLQNEDSLSPALGLFETIISVNGNPRIPLETYHSLLRGCAYRGNASAAAHVFTQFQSRKDVKTSSTAYKHLIQAYAGAGEIDNAEHVFAEYREICRSNPEKLAWGSTTSPYDRGKVTFVWNQMIDAYFKAGLPEKAVGLVELSMNATTTSSPSTPESTAMDVPLPASSMFSTVLSGFCDSGDASTAFAWFNRLLEERQGPQGEDSLVESRLLEAIHPNAAAWNLMIESLASHGMADELNNVFGRMLIDGVEDGIAPTATQRLITFAANMKQIPSLGSAEAEQRLVFLVDKVMLSAEEGRGERTVMDRRVWEECISRGFIDLGTRVWSNYAQRLVSLVRQGAIPPSALSRAKKHLTAFSNRFYEATKGNISLDLVLGLSRFARSINKPPFADEHVLYVLHSYGLARRAGSLPPDMQPVEWADLLNAAIQVEAAEMNGRIEVFPTIPDYAFDGAASLLRDMEAAGVSFGSFDKELINRVLSVLFLKYDAQELKSITSRLGPEFQNDMEQAKVQSPASILSPGERNANSSSNASSPTVIGTEDEAGVEPSSLPDALLTSSKFYIDVRLSREVDDLLRNSPVSRQKHAAEEAYARLTDAVHRGRLPSAITTGRIIESLGRAGDVDKVKAAYNIAQSALSIKSGLKHWPPDSWSRIENSMVIALAHARDTDTAHVHRYRLLESGSAPTADAYGVLILYMKDTTDDTSNALILFQEAEERNVTPNQYLYNNIISKLAKARKAEHALELFGKMKSQNIPPSSITYGAVIGACARVGDVQRVETLFAEMEAAQNFKPRAPPYNTMMQLYTTTKPNREKALFYYEKMKQAGVAPTSHTYKLLMDAYGALEPVDIESMEKVFLSLQRDTSVSIQGTHFASLINAYGCVVKDIERALAVFESIPSYYPGAQPADAVVYEAVINVLVVNKRPQLIQDYVNKMREQGVRMTAYIANFLIKGYANAGELDQARAIFEGLADPAEGVAAPGNHISHEPSVPRERGSTDPTVLVYREPSTWEAMIRAELGTGERARALELLERLKARKYPDAVFNRISGILMDHSLTL